MMAPSISKLVQQRGRVSKPISRFTSLIRTPGDRKQIVTTICFTNDIGVICGVTTNPSLIAKEGRDFNEVIKEIASIVDWPINGEVIALDSKGMIKKEIKTNVTLIFSTGQALLAARTEACRDLYKKNRIRVSNFICRISFIGIGLHTMNILAMLLIFLNLIL